MKARLQVFLVVLFTALVAKSASSATNTGDKNVSGQFPQVQKIFQASPVPTCPSSPIAAPKVTDTAFVADCGSGLDTGCTYRGGGPLTITIPIKRVLSEQDREKLKQNGLLSEKAVVKMPAYDVDFVGGDTTVNPERDRVTFNGHVVPEEYLQGDNGIWRLNEFTVPVEWVKFADDPGEGGVAEAKDNTVVIDIDTQNSDEIWCTGIDWAAVTIDKMPNPVVMAHGILSNGAAWNQTPFSWVQELRRLGIANSNALNMGALDSIQNNAGKISNEVSRTKDRYGVEKVKIVAHSKGGIDSRHFVENDDSVESLVQLGTPNGGSPLADVAQGILVYRFGLPTAVLVNALAGPAGIQLTTPFMRAYNVLHGSNKKVKYTALAGNYKPDCGISITCRPIERLLLAITGAGDTIVPTTSVHTLPYTKNVVFETSGTDKDSLHTSINKSERVFRKVESDVEEQVQRSAIAVSAEPVPVLGKTETLTGNIHQGEVQVYKITIDEETDGFFTMMYLSGNLDLALTSPSGKRIDSTTIGGIPSATMEDSEILGGRIESFNITGVEVGEWTLEVSALQVTDPSGVTGFGINAWIENPAITLEGGATKVSIKPGETLRVAGKVLKDGLPLINASVSATIALPDNAVVAVAMNDDGQDGDGTAGDGVYTGEMSGTKKPGNYKINIIARRGAAISSSEFSREVFALASVTKSDSTIGGQIQAFGEDSDGDGFYNKLAIEVGLDITADAKYTVLGVLEDTKGNNAEASVKENLGVGQTTATLRFDGEEIYTNRVDGPFKLKVIRLVEEDDLVTALVDERENAYETPGYKYTEFQHTPIALTGDDSATGVDTNGNGRFERLDVRLGIEIKDAGQYTWSARLTDAGNVEVGFATGNGNMNAGIGDVILQYDGVQIGQSGRDGPYHVKGLLIFGGGGSLTRSEVLTTPPFFAEQFEGFVVTTNKPPVANAGAEISGTVGQVVTLTGSANDPDKGPAPLTYTWTQISGPAVTLNGANSLMPSFTPTLAGTYVFQLVANDGKDSSAPDSVGVTVTGVVGGAIRLLQPNGGEVWKVGTWQTIKWSVSPTLVRSKAPASIWVSKDAGRHWLPIGIDLRNPGSYTWKPERPFVTGKALVKVCTLSKERFLKPVCDASDATFSIIETKPPRHH